MVCERKFLYFKGSLEETAMRDAVEHNLRVQGQADRISGRENTPIELRRLHLFKGAMFDDVFGTRHRVTTISDTGLVRTVTENTRRKNWQVFYPHAKIVVPKGVL